MGSEGDAEASRSISHMLKVPLHDLLVEEESGCFDVDHATKAETAPASASALFIDAAARDLHPFQALDSPRTSHEMRRDPARQADEDRSPRRRPQTGDVEARYQPRNESQGDA